VPVDAAPGDEMTEHKFLVAARALGPSLAARSTKIEAARTLPSDVVADLRDADLMRLCVPGVLGGPELSPADVVSVIEEVAYHDGAAGWCVMIAATTSLLAAFLPPVHATEIYGDATSITGGFAAPVGRARPVDGGLEVTGRWQWGSGTQHCTWIGGGCLLVGSDGQPTPRLDGLAAPFVLFRPSQVELLDTWHVSGLKGTGSTDYEVNRAFVPEGRWVEIGAVQPLRGRSLYRFSFFGMLALGISAVTLGLARRAIDELVALAGDKRPQGSSRTLAERTSTQADVASAEATVDGARALVDRRIAEAWATVERGDPLTDDQRRDLRLAATHAALASAHAVDVMYDCGGGASIFDASPLQRTFRDIHVATQHAMVAPRTLEPVGRMRLGLATDTRQL